MWFLIKGTFWFSLVLVLLPFLDPASNETLQQGPKVDVGDTFSAATEAFGYISAICVQKPDVCEKGAETFLALGHRAREGARIAYDFLGETFVEPGDAVLTGTVTVTRPSTATREPGETPADTTPEIGADGDGAPVFARTPVPEKRIEPARASAAQPS